MKVFKQIYLIASVLLCSSIISSCDLNEDDSKSLFYLTLGTVINEDELMVESDSHGILVPSNPGYFTSAKLDTTGQRILMSVPASDLEAMVPDGEQRIVDIVELYKVLTKDANDLRNDSLISENDTDFGNDPVQITGISISAKHLNIEVYIKGNDREKPHRLSLLLNKDCKLDENGWLPVELRHNAEGDSQKNVFWSVVSFNLSSIPEYQNSTFKGFRVYYNNGTNPHATCEISKGQTLNQKEINTSRIHSNNK